jgi:hypothetical protein
MPQVRSEVLEPLHGEVVIVGVHAWPLGGPHLLLEPVDKSLHLL